MRPLTNINPIYHFGVIARAACSAAPGLNTLWPNFLILFAFTLVLVSLSVWRFESSSARRTRHMTKPVSGTIRMRGLAAILLFAGGAFAQAGGAPGAMVNQLPLSGRTAQSGSVTATESPVPGTTTSVNTINPTLQMSGSYAGSTGSSATLPFSGKLSLREAVERALKYNLGAVAWRRRCGRRADSKLVARSSLLPNLNGALHEFDEKIDLKGAGAGKHSESRGLASFRGRPVPLLRSACHADANRGRYDGPQQLPFEQGNRSFQSVFG